MMKRYYLTLLAVILSICVVWGQNPTQAKKLFDEGEYAQALPLYKKLVAQNPNSGNYNYWYAVCLCETGRATEALPHLRKAVEKKVPQAHKVLAGMCYEEYRFDEAVAHLEQYIQMQQQKKIDLTADEECLSHYRQCARMLKGTEKVTIVDSLIVPKEAFLEAYAIGQETGTLDTYNSFFNATTQPESVVYQTELKNKVYFALTRDEQTSLYSQDRLGDGWSKAAPLKGLQGGNTNFPFLMSDGTTFYYAADGEGSLGGYDIYVTRYNTETNQFLRSENLGMPFNSPYNDYMYAIDEFNNLGWFASDRYQPADSVCVYVFIPQETRHLYDFEQEGEAIVRRAAMIRNIRDTWSDLSEVEQAKGRLTTVRNQQPTEELRYDFTFIIDDSRTYHFLTDFKSPEARRLFSTWQQEQKEQQGLETLLEEKRMKYAHGTPAQRENLKDEILELEQTVEQHTLAVDALTRNIRSAEVKVLSL